MMHGRNYRHAVVSIIWPATLLLALAALPSRGHAAAEPVAPSVRTETESAAEVGKYYRLTKEQNLAACLNLWEPATHMTKRQWKAVCMRIETTE
jgi:hypothetical protein